MVKRRKSNMIRDIVIEYAENTYYCHKYYNQKGWIYYVKNVFFRLKDYEYMMVNYGNAISEYLNNDEYDMKYSNYRINAKYRKEILEF